MLQHNYPKLITIYQNIVYGRDDKCSFCRCFCCWFYNLCYFSDGVLPHPPHPLLTQHPKRQCTVTGTCQFHATPLGIYTTVPPETPPPREMPPQPSGCQVRLPSHCLRVPAWLPHVRARHQADTESGNKQYN